MAEIVKAWCDFFNEPIDEQTIENSSMLKAVMEGRLDLNEDTEEFTVGARKPLTLENGQSVSSISVKDPGASYLLDKQKVMKKGNALEKWKLDAVASQMTLATDLALGVLRTYVYTTPTRLTRCLGFFDKIPQHYPPKTVNLFGR